MSNFVYLESLVGKYYGNTKFFVVSIKRENNLKKSKTQISIYYDCHYCGKLNKKTSSYKDFKRLKSCSRSCTNNTHNIFKREKAIKFISESNIKHNNLYINGYDRIILDNLSVNQDIEVKCPIHGYFKTTPYRHLKCGNGCPKCGIKKRAKTQSLEWEDFLLKAAVSHGTNIKNFDYTKENTENYFKNNYSNNRTKIPIWCKINNHKFEQVVQDHLSGKGCQQCARKDVGKKNAKKLDEFLKLSEAVHAEDPYTYPNISNEYKSMRSKITIKHQKCGEETTVCSARNHIHQGSGCKKCYGAISKAQLKWLISLGIPEEIGVREIPIKVMINGKEYTAKVDALLNGIIYEFLGDYWHGNPNNPRTSHDRYNKKSKKSFKELYEHTMQRIAALESLGYKVVYIWESDWKKQNTK